MPKAQRYSMPYGLIVRPLGSAEGFVDVIRFSKSPVSLRRSLDPEAAQRRQL
jgi:hypothetical protein